MTQPVTQPNPADYWTGPAVWLFDPVGYPTGAVMFVGPILFPAGLNPGATQTAMMVLGPGGGQINVPPVATGPAGPAATLRNANLTQVPYGEALPNPPAQFNEILPGVYDLDFALNEGPPGQSGSFSIETATDYSGTAANGDTIAFNSTAAKFQPQPFPVGNWYNVTGIAATGAGAGQVRSLTSIAVPPQQYAWVPLVFMSADVNGTANTQVDVVARMGGTINSQSGSEVARGFGRLGAVSDTPTSIPSFAGGLLTSGYAQVAAGNGATIWCNCEEQQGTTDEFSTGRAGFSVLAYPVL